MPFFEISDQTIKIFADSHTCILQEPLTKHKLQAKKEPTEEELWAEEN